MKTFVQWINFPLEIKDEFIRNDYNNENWLTSNEYLRLLNSWDDAYFKAQQYTISKYIEYLKSKKRGDEFFIIQIKNAISYKLKIIRDPDFTHLDGNEAVVKEDFITGKWTTGGTIQITDQFRDSEIESLKEGLEIYEKFKKFTGKWPDIKLEEGFSFLQTYKALLDWNNNRSQPLSDVKKLLEQWREDYLKDDSEFPEIEDITSLQIEIKERTEETLTFVWTVAKIQVPIYDKDNPKIITGYTKRRIFPVIDNFLFYFNGRYYEVKNWKQTGAETAEIVATLSIFYNFYYDLTKAGVNGILHHSPLAVREICSCAEYDRADIFQDFICDFELVPCIYKTSVSSASPEVIVEGGKAGNEGSLPMVHGIPLRRVGKMRTELRWEVLKVLTEAFISNTWNALSGISIAGFSLGGTQLELGVLYHILDDRMGDDQRYITPADQEKRNFYKPKEAEGLIKNVLDYENDINTYLQQLGVLDENKQVVPFMSHFFYWHIKATLYWRKKQIWEGRYWMLHKYGFKVSEVCNAAGISLNFYAYDLLLTKTTENITAKLGLSANGASLLNVSADVTLNDDKGQNARQIERSVVSEGVKNGKAFRDESEVKSTIKTSTITTGEGQLKPKGKIASPQSLLFGNDHNKSEYTFLQFENRWQNSQYHPIGLRLQFNQDLFNQYKNRKQLKGFPAYDYFNALEFGSILNSPGYLQASIISWNASFSHDNWFRERIENGVNIRGKDYLEFYKRKVDTPLQFLSKGATIRGSWNTSISSKNCSTVGAEDRQVYVDGRSWIMKSSFFRVRGGSMNWFPELIDQMSHNLQPNTPFKVKDGYWAFRGDANGVATKFLPTITTDTWYDFRLKGFSPEADVGEPEFRCVDEKGLKIVLTQNGGRWKLQIIGNVEKNKVSGNPEGVPILENRGIDIMDSGGGTKTPTDYNIFNPTQAFANPIFELSTGGDTHELEPDREQDKKKEKTRERTREKAKEKPKERAREKPKSRQKESEKSK